jgi:hypothetical protein
LLSSALSAHASGSGFALASFALASDSSANINLNPRDAMPYLAAIAVGGLLVYGIYISVRHSYPVPREPRYLDQQSKNGRPAEPWRTP